MYSCTKEAIQSSGDQKAQFGSPGTVSTGNETGPDRTEPWSALSGKGTVPVAWEFKNGIPIYLQIVDGIKIRIAGGELPPGSKIPSVRDLAAEAGVNPNTMQRALTQLEQEGLLHAQRTSGRYVTEDEQKMKELRRSLSEKYVEELFTQLSRLGMTREEIIAEVSSWKAEEPSEQR